MAIFVAIANVHKAPDACRHVSIEIRVRLVSGWVGDGAVGEDLFVFRLSVKHIFIITKHCQGEAIIRFSDIPHL